MVYLFVVIIVLWGVYWYDFHGKSENRGALFYYILALCICISAFKFRVGSDILIYMAEYETYLPIGKLNLTKIFENTNRQPGWIIGVSLLKSISPSFILFQIVQATFVNSVIFLFIKKNTRYVFTAIFFYFVYIYTELNFEVMRESFAIAFFILGLDALKNKKWLVYYLYVLLAFSFHLSSFFLFFLPLIRLLPINRYTLTIYFVFLSVILFCFLPFLNDSFKGITFFGSIEEKAESYLNFEKYNVELTKGVLFKIFVYFSVCYYIIMFRTENKEIWLIQLVVIYFLFDILNRGLPFFYRFNNYISLPFVVLLTNSLYLSINHYFFKRCRLFVFICVFSFFCYFPIMSYFVLSNQVPVYRKYIPYYSIFSGKCDPIRESEFK